MTTASETPLTFPCEGETLIGILHRPAAPRKRGVVLVVGAPQYRAGSHRHFVLLARALAEAGYAVLRFDYRGMGDSDGPFVGFEGVKQDIGAAIDALLGQIPDIQDVALWGLCDGATAIAFYAATDPRVAAAVLLNPWVRSDISVAQGRLSQNYLAKATSRQFWLRVIKGEVRIVSAAADLARTLWTILLGRLTTQGPRRSVSQQAQAPLPVRAARSLLAFEGRLLLILSGQDLTAHEFDRAVLDSSSMKDWLGRSNVTLKRLPDANHTYSRQEWRAQVHSWSLLGLEG